LDLLATSRGKYVWIPLPQVVGIQMQSVLAIGVMSGLLWRMIKMGGLKFTGGKMNFWRGLRIVMSKSLGLEWMLFGMTRMS
jgi:hypothetical protein